MLAGCLLSSLPGGCAWIIGIEDLPEIDAGPNGSGDAPDRTLVPSHGVSKEHLAGVTGALVVPEQSGVTVDTNTGEIVLWDVDGNPRTIHGASEGVEQGIGFDVLDDLALVAVDALRVDWDGELSATGRRPLVLLSRGDVSIRGRVNVSAPGGDWRWEGGPGGGTGGNASTGSFLATGCAPGQPGAGIAGGGGGGFRDDGGAGGQSTTDFAVGGAGGSPDIGDCPRDLVWLAGGSGGGAGGPDAMGGAGGGGGGAVQITSFTRIEILGDESSGTARPSAGIEPIGSYTPIAGIFANGSGGTAGGGEGLQGGGGGGGSGGAILLEAPQIEIRDAYVTANGGGGGGSSAASVSEAGIDGYRGDWIAEGGAGEAQGGTGGASSFEATAGASAAESAGGGGGSTGVIHVHAPHDQLVIEGAVLSPELSAHEPTWE